jgi:LysR family glycine cleavage system transcriptional activator
MSLRTPPLPALRAFATLVQLGSVNAAADALSLTTGAVTHQIRALERFLDLPLVQREGRSLALTEQGRIYGYQVRQALDDIAQATESTRRTQRALPADPVVRVSVLPSFAHGWLLPRLPAFCRLYPQVRLALHGSMDYADLNAGVVDCAIRFGHGHWPDAVVSPLMGDTLVLLAAPRLMGKRTPSLAQVMRWPRLQASESWSAWLSSLPTPPPTPAWQSSPPRMAFTDSTHLLEAARLGLGVALSRRSIADQLLQSGDLVLAHPHECGHSSQYYTLLPQGKTVCEPVAQILGWLQVQCARFGQVGCV